MKSGTSAGQGRAVLRTPSVWLLAYAIFIAVVALWPTPVDRPLASLITAVSRLRVVEFVTQATSVGFYAGLEFVANILWFAPFGALLALMMPKRRYAVIPLGFAVSATIELLQGFLPERTSSVRDVVANTIGACLGLLVVVVAEARVARRRGA